ncbi:transcriptional regulator, XRE family [Desulforamulus reducens MI-1]|uniref:Transcriptional regulator, XRE family n=1 Tax=Desulforamulus reducens (strain ATCC BAA-1160 / DSM 100696 / MI-1) TaxID=349161 RepID=A4J300_DESRM|nr:helix-turn-helix domain-containing protein [Desulforamulus reducens]ABO49453.1 transcriptional regulator, XRE family [Desulforamulus reducens MI-1]
MRNLLKKARIEKGYSVSRFAILLGISESFYYKIEKGVRNPTIELAKKIAILLDKTVDEIFFNPQLDETSIYKILTTGQ